MRSFVLVTRVTRQCWEGVGIPTGHIADWPDLPRLYDDLPDCCAVCVTTTTPSGDTESAPMTAYRLRDGDWFLPFLRVLVPGTIVRASTSDHR